MQNELSHTREELENWTSEGFQLGDQKNNETPTSKKPSSSRNGSSLPDSHQLTKLLQNLSRLSKTIADDADADEMALKDEFDAELDAEFDEGYTS